MYGNNWITHSSLSVNVVDDTRTALEATWVVVLHC